MKKYLVLVVGALAALVGYKAFTPQQKLESTAQTVKDAAGGKADIQIKPLNKILIAPQDVTGPDGKGGDKGGKSRKRLA